MHFFLSFGVFVCWRNEKVVRLQPHIVCCVPLPLMHHRCTPNRSSLSPLFWLFDLSGSEAYICLFMQPNTMNKHTSSSSSSSQKLSALVRLYSTMCHFNVRYRRNHNATMNSSSKSTILQLDYEYWWCLQCKQKHSKRWTWYLKLVRTLIPIKWLLYYWLFKPFCKHGHQS